MTTTRALRKRLANNYGEITNIVLFTIGKSISLFGTSIYGFALSLYVLKLTGSGLSFATTLVLNMLPRVIFNPLAGVLADKYDKKLLVILGDILNGFLLIGLYLFSARQGLSLMMIYVSTFLMTVLSTTADINITAAVPNLVSKNKLMNINSISKIINSAADISGPMIGGMIYALVDLKIFIIINAVSFLFSGVLECFINFNFNKEKNLNSDKRVNFLGDIKEGFKYMKGQKMIINLFFIFVFLNFFMSMSLSVPLPFIINNVLKLGSRYFGIIQGSFPIGMILGALSIKKIIEKTTYQRLLLLSNFMIALNMIILILPLLISYNEINHLILLFYYSIIMIIVGISVSFIDIPLMVILQNIIPDNYRGRVISLGISMGKIIAPIGLVLSGIMINNLPPYLLSLFGGVMLILFSYLFYRKGVYNNLQLSAEGVV